MFSEDRQQFYCKVDHFWHDLYGEEYALFDIAFIDKKEAGVIHQASDRIGRIFFKIASLLRSVPDETLLEMGYPKEALAFLRLKVLQPESVISRLDLVKNSGTYKVIELNSDTPTFIKELFHVNGFVCEEFNAEDPNSGMAEKLSKAVRNSIFESAIKVGTQEPYIVFTAHKDNEEDRNTALYLQEIAGLPSRFIPLDQLQIEQGSGLYDNEGRRVDVLYRQTFPVENLISDEDQDGNQIGQWLLELVENGKLAVVNPPSAFLLQNKAVMAVIWGLHQERNSFFTEIEHEWIAEHFLPTYLEPAHFLKNNLAFVKKPVFGREGDTVQIFDEAGQLKSEDKEKSYTEYMSIYQEFIELPVIPFKAEKGERTGHQLVGSFLISGRNAAIGFRVGDAITNNLSYYLPIGIKKG